MKKYRVLSRNKDLKGRFKYVDTYLAESSDEAIKVAMADLMQTCCEFGMSRLDFLAHCSHIEFKAVKEKNK